MNFWIVGSWTDNKSMVLWFKNIKTKIKPLKFGFDSSYTDFNFDDSDSDF